MNNSSQDIISEFRKFQDFCRESVERGDYTKMEATKEILDKAMEILQGLKAPEPIDPLEDNAYQFFNYN